MSIRNVAYGTLSARPPPLEPKNQGGSAGGGGIARPSVGAAAGGVHNLPMSAAVPSSQRIIVETITMTTVTERRIVGGITDNRITNITASQTPTTADGQAASTTAAGATTAAATAASVQEEEAPALPPKESHAAKAMLMNAEPPPDPASLAGILKGGKMWKSETVSGRGGRRRLRRACT